MGNKHAHRLLTGTSFHETETDQERAKVCAKMFKTYKKGLNYKHVEDISAEELMQLMQLEEEEKRESVLKDQSITSDTSTDAAAAAAAAAATVATTPVTKSRRDVVLIDCRDDYERMVSSIPGSIGESELEEKLEQGWQVNAQTHQLIFFCTIGYRSGVSAHKFAKKTNITPVYNLAGSLLSWVHSGGELQDPTTQLPSKQLHVFGPAWDLAPHHITTVIGGKQNKQEGLKVLTQGKHLVTDDDDDDDKEEQVTTTTASSATTPTSDQTDVATSCAAAAAAADAADDIHVVVSPPQQSKSTQEE